MVGSLDELRALRREGMTADAQAAEKLRILQESIRTGHSTGDSITDFVILNYSGAEKVEERIRALDENLRKNKGGLVALEECYSYSWGKVGCFGGDYTKNPSQILLGRIQEPFLKLDESKDDLVTRIFSKGGIDAEISVDPLLTIRGEAHADSKNTSFWLHEDTTLELGKTIPVVLLAYLQGVERELMRPQQLSESIAQERIKVILGEDVRHHGRFNGERTTARVEAYNLHVGTEAVDAFAEKLSFTRLHHRYDKLTFSEFYAQQKRLLLDDTACQEYFVEKERRVEAARVLGANIIAIELLQKVYVLEEKRTATEAEPQDIVLQKSVELFERSVTELLGKAVKQGLHQQQREFTPAYLPGVRINVAEMVTGLCAQYKIEIKKILTEENYRDHDRR